MAKYEVLRDGLFIGRERLTKGDVIDDALVGPDAARGLEAAGRLKRLAQSELETTETAAPAVKRSK